MEQIRNSFFLRLVNKLDITEDSAVFQCFKQSFFLNLINKFFCFTRNLFSQITRDSWFLAKIDYFILFVITLLMISLTFAPANTIGIIAGLGFLALLIKLLTQKGAEFSINPTDIPILAYIALVLLSVAFSDLLIPSIKGFAKVMVYFASYLVFFNILKNKPSRSVYFLGIIALTAFAESLTAIYQNFTGVNALATWQDTTGINPEQLMTRVYGTLKPYNPNLLAGYLIATLSSAIGMFFLCVYKKKPRLSIVSLLAFIGILLAIVFTGSRGAYLGAGGILCAVVLTSGHVIRQDFPQKTWLRKLWFYVVLLGVLATLFLVLSSPSLQHRIASIFAFREDSSNSFRINVYIASAKMFFDNWLTGIGPGNEVFRLTYGLYMKTGFDALGAYSVPLEIAVESGVLALGAFIWLIAAIFLKTAKIVLHGTSIEQKIIVSCCMTGILGIMVHGLVDTIFFRPQVQMVFWMLIAILGTSIKPYPGLDSKSCTLPDSNSCIQNQT